MKFLSICSGIEAASVAWGPLGWQAVGFSEIEPFPAAVLKHHYPDVINYGDMTKLVDMFDLGLIELPDVLCGGTPCQAFSVAGLRKSLEDERGNLSLVFCEIANAIDRHRANAGLEAGIVFWENVPGVLNTKDNAFGCFLAGLAGESEPLQPAGGKWTDAGVVLGPQRAVAWRVLDAQYFGLAQRRKRVFVVASAREGFDPAAILLEWQGVRRDSAPSREAGQRAAPTIAGCSNGGGANGPGRDVDSCESLQVMSSGQANAEIRTDGGAPTLTCLHEAPIVAHSPRGEGFDVSEDGTGRGTPLVPVGVPDVMATLLSSTAGISRPGNAVTEHETYIPMAAQPVAIQGNLIGRDAGGPHGVGASASGLMYTLTTADVHGVAQPVAFSSNMSVPDCTTDGVTPTLKLGGHGGGNPPAIAHCVAQPIVLMDQGGSVMDVITDGTVGTLRRETHGHEPAVVQPIAFAQNTRNEVRLVGGDGQIVGALAAEPGMKQTSYVAQPIPLDLRNAGRDPEKHDEQNRQGVGVGEPGEPSHTLTSACVHGVAAQPIALQDVRGIDKAQGGKGWNDDGVAYTLDTHATQGVMQPIAWDEELNASVDQAGTLLRGGDGGRHDGVLAPTLTASNNPSRSPQSSEITAQVAAVVRATGFDAYNNSVTGDVSKTLDVGQDHHHVPLAFAAAEVGPTMGSSGPPYSRTGNERVETEALAIHAMQVRRLTPVECERLQGFPDQYTNIPWRGKTEAPDGPRYKALGNSWAVPVVRWIGNRIEMHMIGLL